jgi:ribosomal protein S18 acetylase RimI-like enzyme
VAEIRIVDVVDLPSFELMPPCADPRFDHRTCDYWEDAGRGSKSARASWLRTRTSAEPSAAANPFAVGSGGDNPFAPRPMAAPAGNPFAPRADALAGNPFARRDDDAAANPFLARSPAAAAASVADDAPPKLRLLARGLTVFGAYAKVLEADGMPAAYCQYGPLTAYPRAQRLRDLYPALPQSPPPAVITCIATTADARDRGFAARLVENVCDDLAARGFVAVEAYPEVGADEDETSAATADFWVAARFSVAAADDRFPVLRRELA